LLEYNWENGTTDAQLILEDNTVYIFISEPKCCTLSITLILLNTKNNIKSHRTKEDMKNLAIRLSAKTSKFSGLEFTDIHIVNLTENHISVIFDYQTLRQRE
jgi:hypothetical protein